MDAAAKAYEVTLKTENFANYLKHHGLEETITAVKGGRKQKEGWRHVCSYMAAYMVAHHRDSPEVRLKIKKSSDEIFKLAKDDQIPDLPSADSIKEQVSKAMTLLDRPDFHPKK